jgi:hypothetical protein
LLASERPASGLRRVTLREAQRLSTSAHRHPLPERERARMYRPVDGQWCPTREPRQSAEDQGSREAKAVVAFSQHDGAEVSKERPASVPTVLQATSTDREDCRGILAQVSRQAHGEQAAAVIVWADGARWIWLMVEAVRPQAIQILDCRHAPHALWDAGKMLDGEGSACVAPWVQDQETLGLENTVEQVIAHLLHCLAIRPALAALLHDFQQHAARMQYGTYRQRGDGIGSGAMERAGKQRAAARIKGPGLRWHVTDLNALLALRCVFLERSWQTDWTAPERRIA